MYLSSEYLQLNPTWDVQDSPWKARHIHEMLERNGSTPKHVCEVGCGAGEILRQLQLRMPDDVEFWGYEISPDAYQLCVSRENERLHFRLADFLAEKDGPVFDLIILADVIEHIEDYFGFLRQMRGRAKQTILHIPLDMSAQMVARGKPIMGVRKAVGHLHYFNRDTALAALRDTGYSIIDARYTPSVVELPKSFLSRIARWPRRVAFRLNQDLAVRLLGGYSLLVLAS
jgi:SAM-dependent methyltransferase